MAELTTNAKVDTGYFLQKWEEYKKITSRTIVQAVNDKMYMVARASLWFTKKAATKDIEKALGKASTTTTKTGKARYNHRLVKSRDYDAPLIAVIINQRKGPGGGFKGPGRFLAMRQEIQKVMSARRKSIAYIKSGWLTAIQGLGKVSSIKTANQRKYDEEGIEQIGKAKGSFEMARIGDVVTCKIRNEASATRDTKAAFEKYGSRGLQAGVDHEAKDMAEQVEKAMKEDAETFNRLQNVFNSR
jgi:hypothetical protein